MLPFRIRCPSMKILQEQFWSFESSKFPFFILSYFCCSNVISWLCCTDLILIPGHRIGQWFIWIKHLWMKNLINVAAGANTPPRLVWREPTRQGQPPHFHWIIKRLLFPRCCCKSDSENDTFQDILGTVCMKSLPAQYSERMWQTRRGAAFCCSVHGDG